MSWSKNQNVERLLFQTLSDRRTCCSLTFWARNDMDDDNMTKFAETIISIASRNRKLLLLRIMKDDA
ncbi:MAG: hypothetical protein WA364_24645 [Candidatus Nitrosopolaris sp.]